MVDRCPPVLRSSWRDALWASLPALLLWPALAVGLLLALPEQAYRIKLTHGLVAFSLFGLWRYAWQAVNLCRAAIYLRRVYPGLRETADAAPLPSWLYIVVATFGESPDVSATAMTELGKQVAQLNIPVTLVAVTGSGAEDDVVSRACQQGADGAGGGKRVTLVLLRQEHGKRSALAQGLRHCSREFHSLARPEAGGRDAVVALMDGDTLLQDGALARSLPFFNANPKLGAATVNNIGLGRVCSSLLSSWFNLKFAQRHLHFSSHALSRRVLTLTGRLSFFRAALVLDQEFLQRLEADHMDHWLFGRFPFLMGDDKSTWYEILRRGVDMLYLPDVFASSLESRDGAFLPVSLGLMRRWYGNMLRANSRSLRLGPGRMGLFIWWCLLEQRLSAITPLVGIAGAMLLSVAVSGYFLIFYLTWVVFTRSAYLTLYALSGRVTDIFHLPAMVYNQWAGALVKNWSLATLDRQQWGKNNGQRRIQGQAQGQTAIFGGVRLLLMAANVGIILLLSGMVTGVFLP